ncbi:MULTISPECIES: hypothetical protein [unclassified Streptomyces]|uniref:hypothetical protein n=1 Tax=unclassified Streptomyces TaxID=2593676 RepID=UPI0035DC846E
MSQEAAPEQVVPEQPAPRSVPEQKGTGAPKGLLQQMEELMAALSADLNQLDADLQSTSDRLLPEQSASDRLLPEQSAPDRLPPGQPMSDRHQP